MILRKFGSSLLNTLLNFDITHAHYVITRGVPLFRYVKRKGLENVAIINRTKKGKWVYCSLVNREIIENMRKIDIL